MRDYIETVFKKLVDDGSVQVGRNGEMLYSGKFLFSDGQYMLGHYHVEEEDFYYENRRTILPFVSPIDAIRYVINNALRDIEDE